MLYNERTSRDFEFPSPGLDFIIKDLPSVFILIMSDQILYDSLCVVLTNTTDVYVDS